MTLFAGAAIVITRLSVATVVEVHGHGMAPTLLDRDHVLLVRGNGGIERGDVVVYRPPLPDEVDRDGRVLREPPKPEADSSAGVRGSDRPPDDELRNTAVVDPDEIKHNFSRLARAYQADDSLRLGRVIALPGDRVSFHCQAGTLGLCINGLPLQQKLAPALPRSDGFGVEPVAYEAIEDRRYRVMVGIEPSHRNPWPRFALPAAADGPAELQADGYLVLADNRDEGACCDSRQLGWIPGAAISGRVMARFAGPRGTGESPRGSDDGFVWRP
jgi:signal peptidase I